MMAMTAIKANFNFETQVMFPHSNQFRFQRPSLLCS